MKKLLSFLFTITLIISVVPLGMFEFTVNAETSDYYTYTVENKKVTITDVDTAISGNITIPSTLGGYTVTSIGAHAFYNCDSLTSVTISGGVTSIGDYAFQGCDSLTSVIISGGVTSIGSYAFYNSISLTSVTISKSVTSIGAYAFDHCNKLEKIIVDENNSKYCSIDGVLFNKGVTTLIKYPMGKTETVYTIPDSVTSISFYAFYYAYYLTNVTIPDTVTSIGYSAFGHCFGLTSITIPKSVTSIGERVFEWGSLASVFYRGSKDEKAKIAIGSDNSDLSNATWYYNSCIEKAKHTYNNNCDIDCNVCGDLRSISHTDINNDNMCDICDEMLFTLGDINDDDQINNEDLGILMQYINGWDVQITIAAADVNADEDINNKDYVLLIRDINGWNVELQ